MHVAFIGQKRIPAPQGGVERHVEAIATRMAAQGHTVCAYVRGKSTSRGYSRYKKVRLIYAWGIPTKNLDAITHTLFATCHALFRRYDVIHYQGIGPASLCWLVRVLKPRTAVVATFHSQDYQHEKWSRFARLYLRWSEYISCIVPHATIVVSRYLQDYAERTYGRKTYFIANGFEGSAPFPPAALRRWGLEERRYLLAVARLVPHKGIHHLLTAFQRLSDKGEIPPRFQLVIVGTETHTAAYMAALKAQAKGYGNIRFAGNQNGRALATLFSYSYLFIHPSLSEGLSIALLEAMGYGAATLISDIPPNQEAVGKTAAMFRAGNIEDLERALRTLLAKPGKLPALRVKAKERARTYFRWEDIVEKTLQLYCDVIEKVATS